MIQNLAVPLDILSQVVQTNIQNEDKRIIGGSNFCSLYWGVTFTNLPEMTMFSLSDVHYKEKPLLRFAAQLWLMGSANPFMEIVDVCSHDPSKLCEVDNRIIGRISVIGGFSLNDIGSSDR